MRDLLFKNLTSANKKKRVIATSEIMDKAGVRSIIRRHFVCIVKEIQPGEIHRPLPYVYVLKEHNNKEQREKFFCRIKGNIFAVNNGKLFLILFTHSLKITLTAVSKDLVKQSQG
jgi:hypothetical protein